MEKGIKRAVDGLCKEEPGNDATTIANGKKTKGRVKIKMEFIDNKLRRYTTFSKRKTGIMKKAYELSTLTGTQVMLLVASETGHVYTFATKKLQPMITSDAGKALIQTCLNTPDEGVEATEEEGDQRMCAEGFEETELMYAVDNENEKNWHTDYAKGSDDDEYWENEDDTSESDKPTNLSLNKDRDSPPLSNPEQKPTAKRKITKNSNSRDLLQPGVPGSHNEHISPDVISQLGYTNLLALATSQAQRHSLLSQSTVTSSNRISQGLSGEATPRHAFILPLPAVLQPPPPTLDLPPHFQTPENLSLHDKWKKK